MRRELAWSACAFVWLAMLLSAASLEGIALGHRSESVHFSSESSEWFWNRPHVVRIIDRPTVPYSVTLTPDGEVDPSVSSRLLRVAAAVEAFFARAARVRSLPGQSPEFAPRPVPN
jgi:hypothetical protein